MTYTTDDMRDAEWDYELDEILAEYDSDDAEEHEGEGEED